MLRRAKEADMQNGKRSLQRVVLSKLFDHLQEFYGVDSSRDSFLEGRLNLHQIDALLAFKSDPQLDELRSALDRLEHGTYGVCIACKHTIGREILERDPGRRLCGGCEQGFNHGADLGVRRGVMNAYEPHMVF
jgi:RNA polymerase-binding transcription factor DksA